MMAATNSSEQRLKDTVEKWIESLNDQSKERVIHFLNRAAMLGQNVTEVGYDLMVKCQNQMRVQGVVNVRERQPVAGDGYLAHFSYWYSKWCQLSKQNTINDANRNMANLPKIMAAAVTKGIEDAEWNKQHGYRS